MIKEGEMAAPQRPVARVVNLSKVYAQADVSEKYLPSIRKGTQVIIDFPELNKTVQSTVSSVGSFIHPNNRTFKIRIDLLNLDHSLKPNLTGNIKIKDLAVKDALVLPLSMVQEDRNGNNYVFVLQPIEGEKDVYKVVKKVLELGQTYKDEVIVKSGLSTDDILAMQGARGLTEGDKVKISNLEALTAKQETLRQKKQVENKMHTVQKGETLYRIHKKYNVPLTDLRKWNHLKNDKVKVGQKLIVQSKKNQ
jgi:RND family efflux transporter MFP subunit